MPYRLDLTVSVLRRLPTNLVDVLTPDGRYRRALGGPRPVVISARQLRSDHLAVTIEGDASEELRALETVRRILGTDRDLSRFTRAAGAIPWLRPWEEQMRGVKPPRYPTLWEACANAIVFQQVSLFAASAIMGRIIEALGESFTSDGTQLYSFPTAQSVLGGTDPGLLAAGLSAAKLATLRRVAEALSSGALDEAMLEERSSPEATALLCRIKGIGPWTAAVILLRGLGRLDVFPANDTSVVRNLMLAGAATNVDLGATLDTLGPERGMLYYHLLLARLAARGEVRVDSSIGVSQMRPPLF